MVHCHTHYSDGRDSVLEMAQAARRLGMSYITITDHSPTAAYAGGVTLDRLERQWEDIARAQEATGIRILRGTESDILADGSLDYPDRVLEKLDVVVASIHNRYRMDARAMTERVTRALALPLFKIWGHARGRLIGRRAAVRVRHGADPRRRGERSRGRRGERRPLPARHGSGLDPRGQEARPAASWSRSTPTRRGSSGTSGTASTWPAAAGCSGKTC